jgi:hypothetical protein
VYDGPGGDHKSAFVRLGNVAGAVSDQDGGRGLDVVVMNLITRLVSENKSFDPFDL